MGLVRLERQYAVEVLRMTYIIVCALASYVDERRSEISVGHLQGIIGHPFEYGIRQWPSIHCQATHHKEAPKLSLSPANPPQLAVLVSNMIISLPAASACRVPSK